MKRKNVVLRLNLEFLNDLTERLGYYGAWTFAGETNMEVIAWLVRHLVSTKELPPRTVPTWIWSDPSTGQVHVLLYSLEFDDVPEGTMAPERIVMLNHDSLEAAIQRYCVETPFDVIQQDAEGKEQRRWTKE